MLTCPNPSVCKNWHFFKYIMVQVGEPCAAPEQKSHLLYCTFGQRRSPCIRTPTKVRGCFSHSNTWVRRKIRDWGRSKPLNYDQWKCLRSTFKGVTWLSIFSMPSKIPRASHHRNTQLGNSGWWERNVALATWLTSLHAPSQVPHECWQPSLGHGMQGRIAAAEGPWDQPLHRPASLARHVFANNAWQALPGSLQPGQLRGSVCTALLNTGETERSDS